MRRLLDPARYRVVPAERNGDLAPADSRLLHDPDPIVRAAAAREWCTCDSALQNG